MKRLTKRQQDVLRLIASGMTQQQVARELGIKTKTVYVHTQNARDRTNKTTVELAVNTALHDVGE